jgi:hypothetical protein
MARVTILPAIGSAALRIVAKPNTSALSPQESLMPKLVQRLPKYAKHKRSGQAVGYTSGGDVQLEAYNNAASRENDNPVIAERISNHRSLPTKSLSFT